MATLPHRRTWRYEMPVKKYFSSISHVSTLLYGILLYRSKIVSFVRYSKQRMQTLACFVNRGHSGRGGFEECTVGRLLPSSLRMLHLRVTSSLSTVTTHANTHEHSFTLGPVRLNMLHIQQNATATKNHIIDQMQGTKPTQAPKWSSMHCGTNLWL